MNGAADRLIKRLGKAAAKKQEVNIWRMLGDLTMDVVGTASFGWVNIHRFHCTRVNEHINCHPGTQCEKCEHAELQQDVHFVVAFCRVEFKTQVDEDEDPSSSKESRELVMAAQTIFQMGGISRFFFHSMSLRLCKYVLDPYASQGWHSWAGEKTPPSLCPLFRCISNTFTERLSCFYAGLTCRCWRQPLCAHCGLVSCAFALGSHRCRSLS